MRFLLDVNVLLALALPEHASHRAAYSWFRRDPERLWATCPLTQAGFVRLCNRELGPSRESLYLALASMERDCQSPRHEFWPIDVDLRDLADSERSRLIGAGQIADMQLLMLAHNRGGQLATFDKGIRELAVGTRYANSLVIL